MVEEGLRRLIPRARTDPLAFAVVHMRDERKAHLDFVKRPYLVDILRDDRPEHVCIACAQSCKTVTYLTKVFQKLVWGCGPGEKARTAIYTFPTDTHVREFSAARAKPMIASSPLLAGEIGDVENVSLKQFNSGGTLYLRGTFTQQAALSVPADIRVHDELDKSRPDTLQMYSDRTGASDYPHLYMFSTPTLPDWGIAARWQDTDQREWVWRCNECGREQVFAPMDNAGTWVDQLDLGACEVRCIACQAPIPRQAIDAGQWVAMKPECQRAGYHITGIMPPGDRPKRLKATRDEAEYLDLWVQAHIGVPWVSGENQITPDMIRFGDWRNTIVSETDTFAGLDQGKKLDFVCGDGAGRILSVQRYDDWSEVAAAMDAMHIRMLVADAAPDARPLQDLHAQFPGRVVLADYSLTKPGEHPFKASESEPRVSIHRTAALDWTRNRIIMGDDVFPACGPELEATIKSQICAPKRTLEPDAHGIMRAVWRETTADHMRHAHLYYVVAAHGIGAGGYEPFYEDLHW